ncbi:pyrimidodiazepine synthase isoform X2 [Cherax quadricarinatus]|nr:pyrimidodiazepine synthase-like isoform X2 [Cherax quadricarinatus]XP_053649939.1 pyrimidodiazepine synthase-like isoform X2 [Cherax quadricarinatus]
MKYCPYAQRVRIIIAAKNVKHEIVNINLKSKPDWFFEKNPLGKVPALEKDGALMFESMVICDYLNEAYPEPPLYPADPWQKAHDRVFIELWSKVSSPMYKVYFAKGDQHVLAQCFDDIRDGLDMFEVELSKRGTCFFAGAKPGMLDYMIWPWVERLPMAQQMAGDDDALPEERYLKLLSWMTNMKEEPAVRATFMSPETHLKFLLSHISGSPEYDMEE